MGYTSGHPPMFSPDIKQTPENVRKVLDIAGWTVWEAANQVYCSPEQLQAAVDGEKSLPIVLWRDFLDVCGRRAFDHEDAE
jgi:hypothetical protein